MRKNAEIPCYGGFAPGPGSAAILGQGWPNYGDYIGLHWGGCRLRWAILDRSGPYTAPIWPYIIPF